MAKIIAASEAGNTDTARSTSRSVSPEEQTKLQKTQSQEEYILDKYNLVLEALTTVYEKLEEEYMSAEPDLFKDKITRGLMTEVREYMGSNEAHLREVRGELWLGYDEEMDIRLENGMKR